jgi:ribose-phosphate pyrophosphokinase
VSRIESLKLYSRWIAGTALEKAGRVMRRVSNRITTMEILRKYHAGAELAKFSLAGMMQNQRRESFGPPEKTVFLSGSACEGLVDQYLARSDYKRIPVGFKKFRNGEIYARLQQSVRNKTVVFFQDFSKGNINDRLIETLLVIDAAKRASPQKIILVCPGLPYAEDKPGSPNCEYDYFKLVLNLLFKGVELDELQMGNVNLKRSQSFLFLQDKLISREVAPFMIDWGEYLAGEAKSKPKEFVFLAGKQFQESAETVMRELKTKYGIEGKLEDMGLVSQDPAGKIGCAFKRNLNLAGKSVYIFQTCNTGRINDDLIEALLLAYTAKKKGAREIVLVQPFLPYNRQERKAKTREPISAKMVANALVEAAGVTQIITLNLHAAATQGFFDILMQHINAFPQLEKFFKVIIRKPEEQGPQEGWQIENPAVCAPDVGRGKTARKFGRYTLGKNYQIVIIDKDRPKAGVAKVAGVMGEAKGKDIILIDDIIDSAGTIVEGVKALKAQGARRIFVGAIHGLFTNIEINIFEEAGREEYNNICKFLIKNGKSVNDYVKFLESRDSVTVNALVRLQANPDINGIVFTDSINIPRQNIIDESKIRIVTVTKLLADVCGRIIKGDSLEGYQAVG